MVLSTVFAGGTVSASESAEEPFSFRHTFESDDYIAGDGKVVKGEKHVFSYWGFSDAVIDKTKGHGDSRSVKLTSNGTYWGIHFNSIPELKNKDLTGKKFKIGFSIASNQTVNEKLKVTMDYDGGSVALPDFTTSVNNEAFSGYYQAEVVIPTTGSSETMELSIQAAGTSEKGKIYWIDSVSIVEMKTDELMNFDFEGGWNSEPAADNPSNIMLKENPFNPDLKTSLYVKGNNTLYYHFKQLTKDAKVGDIYMVSYNIAPSAENTGTLKLKWYAYGTSFGSGVQVSYIEIPAGSKSQNVCFPLTVTAKGTGAEIASLTEGNTAYYIDNFKVEKLSRASIDNPSGTYMGFENDENLYCTKISDTRYDVTDSGYRGRMILFNCTASIGTYGGAATGYNSLRYAAKSNANAYLRSYELANQSLADKKIIVSMRLKADEGASKIKGQIYATNGSTIGQSFYFTPGADGFDYCSATVSVDNSELSLKELELSGFTSGKNYYFDDISIRLADGTVLFDVNYDDKDQTIISDYKDKAAKAETGDEHKNACLLWSEANGANAIYIKANPNGSGQHTLEKGAVYEFSADFKAADPNNAEEIQLEFCKAYWGDGPYAAHLSKGSSIIKIQPDNNDWKTAKIYFKSACDWTVSGVDIYARVSGKGENKVYIDNLFCKKVKEVKQDLSGSFEIGNITKSDFQNIAKGDKLFVNIDMVSVPQGKPDAKLIAAVAVYDGEKLVAIDAADVSVDYKDVANNIRAEVAVPNAEPLEGYNAKAFIWNGTTLAPVTIN